MIDGRCPRPYLGRMTYDSGAIYKADTSSWMQDYKYVWLAANSTFKADSDLAKYEKARKLKVSRTFSLVGFRV